MGRAYEISNFETEMNRGFLQILALVLLEKPMYGYSMLRHLENLGYIVEESTLYPLLRRLEKNELIQGKWDVSEDRPKKTYSITGKGKGVRKALLRIWDRQDAILKKLSREEKKD